MAMTEQYCEDCGNSICFNEDGDEMHYECWSCTAILNPVNGKPALCKDIRDIGVDCIEYYDGRRN